MKNCLSYSTSGPSWPCCSPLLQILRPVSLTVSLLHSLVLVTAGVASFCDIGTLKDEMSLRHAVTFSQAHGQREQVEDVEDVRN